MLPDGSQCWALDIQEAFDIQIYANYDPTIQPIVNYLEETYIGQIHRHGQWAKTSFPIQLWNVHNRILNGQAHTKNDEDGWHHAFQANVGAHYPNLWNFVKVLKKEQSLINVQVQRANAGELIPHLTMQNMHKSHAELKTPFNSI